MTTSDGSTASYYELPEGATELQHLISDRNMNAQLGEIFRACYRYGQASHSDMMRDAKKIRFYAQAEIERLEKLAMAQLVSGTHLDFDESRMDAIARNGNDGEHYAEDMTDPANWRAGDLVECVYSRKSGRFVVGRIYHLYDDCNGRTVHAIDEREEKNTFVAECFRFHSRPSTGWIEWNGGECPCDELAEVQVQTRDGEYAVRAAGSFIWRHCGDQDDIMRYRML